MRHTKNWYHNFGYFHCVEIVIKNEKSFVIFNIHFQWCGSFAFGYQIFGAHTNKSIIPGHFKLRAIYSHIGKCSSELIQRKRNYLIVSRIRQTDRNMFFPKFPYWKAESVSFWFDNSITTPTTRAYWKRLYCCFSS